MYRCGKEDSEYVMVFSASFANVDRACRHIDEFLRRHGLNQTFVVKLGAREIMNNAIIHGSRRDPAKQVRFSIFLEGNHLYLRSHDAGRGYKASPAPPPQCPLPRESGYGLAILRRYFDSVSFNESGNEITLELKNVRASKGI